MKSTKMIFTILAVICTIVACGPSDSPVEAAREHFEAEWIGDIDMLTERTCLAYQESSVFALSLLHAESSKKLNEEQDFSNVQYELIGESEDSAQVRVYGHMIPGGVITLRFDMTWIIVKEDGKWKMCGEVD